MLHALTLGLIGVLLGLVGFAATRGDPNLGSASYPIAVAVISLPSALLGGWLHRTQSRQTMPAASWSSITHDSAGT